MNHQFKFGDLVSYDGIPTMGVIVGLHDMGNVATVCFEGFSIPKRGIKTNSLKLIQNPDTVRLDYIERVINIDGMVKREMRKGWVLVAGDIELTTPEPLLRDAIDSAMELTSGNSPRQPNA